MVGRPSLQRPQLLFVNFTTDFTLYLDNSVCIVHTLTAAVCSFPAVHVDWSDVTGWHNFTNAVVAFVSFFIFENRTWLHYSLNVSSVSYCLGLLITSQKMENE